jgi:hypothetical protein
MYSIADKRKGNRRVLLNTQPMVKLRFTSPYDMSSL